MQKQEKRIDFSKGSIVKSIVAFSIPVVLGELFQNLYNSVDALAVGNFADEAALAAVTVGGIVSTIIVNFFNGMSVGVNVVVSISFGKGKQEELCSNIRIAFTFSVVLGVVLSTLGILFTPQLLTIAGVQPEYYAEALTYLRIYLAGILFTVIYNSGAGILRAVGDSTTPFRILVLACCTNIVLDLLFVAAFRLGVTGVGIATVISQGLSVGLIYRAINCSQQLCCLDFGEMFSCGKQTILQVLRVGMAAGMQSALIGFSNIFVIRYMNYFDTASVVGIGIAQRLDKFIALPAKAFGITMTTYVSQNIGAGEMTRVQEGKKKCLAVALFITISMSIIVLWLAEPSVRLFNSNPAVVRIGVSMMRVLCPMFWMITIREVYLGVLRGYGKNATPMLLSLIGMVGVRQLFLAVSMRNHPVIENIYLCYPIAWFAAMLLLLCYYRAIEN